MSTCNYHPNRDARWHCPNCQKAFCGNCFPGGDSNFYNGEARCPLCREPMSYQANNTAMPPFWRQSGRFFSYPLQKIPLLLLLICFAAVQLVVTDLSDRFGLLPQLLARGAAILALLVLATNYSLAVIRCTAEDDWQAPPLSGGDITPSLKLMFGYFLVGVVISGLGLQAEPLSIAASLFFTLAVPAISMVLAVTGSMSSAFNPALLFRMIVRIGWSYLLLWLAYTAITNGSMLLATQVLDQEALAAGDFGSLKSMLMLTSLSGIYFMLVASAMMGYTVYANSHKLGIEAKVLGEPLPDDEYAVKRALGFSHIFAQEGRAQAAIGEIRTALGRYPDDLNLRARMHQLLMKHGDDDALLRQGEKYFDLLQKQRRLGVAVQLMDDINRRCPDYQLDVERRLPLAELLHQQGRFDKVEQLLSDLTQWPQDSAAQAQAWLLLAKNRLESGQPLVEVSNAADQAAEHPYAGNQIVEEARTLQQMATKMASQLS